MPARKTLCQVYTRGETAFGNRLEPGGYLAAAWVDSLPAESNAYDSFTERGWAVGFGQWYFFWAIEPAIAFGRAARMSVDCRGYGVYEAAYLHQECLDHGTEHVLLLARHSRDREDDEVEVLKRFVQGVKENPDSAHWHAPTGYIHDFGDGRPVATRRKSLPL